jgi:uncharacterized protein YbaP (TraB family)
MHTVPKGTVFDLDEILAGKKHVLFELSPDELSQATLQPLCGISAEQFVNSLTDKQKKTLQQTYGVNVEQAEKLPLFAIYQAIVSVSLKDITGLGVDHQLYATSKRLAVPARSLETTDEQLEVIRDMLNGEHQLVLLNLLEQSDPKRFYQSKFLDLAKTYLSGKINAMEKNHRHRWGTIYGSMPKNSPAE